MLHILNLFGRSPFAPLQDHMKKVAACVQELEPLFKALKQKDYSLLGTISDRISDLEHAADITKSDIQNHLPGSLFLSIDRNNFLEMLCIQDKIADAVEDISVLLTLRNLELLDAFQKPFDAVLSKNIESFQSAYKITLELPELLESSFGGLEAEKVKSMVDEVAFQEHEVDVIQRSLLQSFYTIESKISFGEFYQWQKIFETVGSISNLSEKLANCIRMMLEVK